MKKIVSILLAFILILSVMSAVSVFAADVDLSVTSVSAEQSTIYDGDNVILFANVRNLSGTAQNFSVNFFADNTLIQKVNVTDSISSGAFKIIRTTVNWTPFFGSHKLKATVETNDNDTDAENNRSVQRVLVLDEVNPNPPAPPAERKKVVGYIPNWTPDCYKSVDWSALTHINIAFVNPKADGTLDHGFWSGDYVLENIVTAAHNNNVKVMISMGGAGGTANYVNLTSAENVDGFCDKIMAFVERFNIDGVDLDIEGDVDNAFWNNYGNFVSKLRTLCTNNNKLFSTAVGQWYANKISDDTFAKFDFVNIMAYDDDKSQHSSYNLARNMLNYFEGRGIAKEDLVLGVPFYGYTTDTGSYTAYNTIISQYPDSWQDDYAGSYAYNGANTIASKCNLAKDYGGIMIWELSQDAQGDKSLLKVIKDNLNG